MTIFIWRIISVKKYPSTIIYFFYILYIYKTISARMKKMVVLGPGDIAQAHTVDEWIELEQLHKGVEVYTRFIDHVCIQGLD